MLDVGVSSLNFRYLRTPPMLQWVYLVATYDGVVVRLYVNSKLVTQVCILVRLPFLLTYNLYLYPARDLQQFHGENLVSIYQAPD